MRLTKVAKKAIVRSIMDDVPKLFTDEAQAHRDIQEALVKNMSAEVRKVYRIAPRALRTQHFSGWEYGFSSSFELIVGDADTRLVTKPYRESCTQRNELRMKIEGIVEGCNTTKQLLAMLPEFEKYIPQEAAPSKNLPAVANVVADLTKMGWPKKGEKA